jgi:hypothetical protein
MEPLKIEDVVQYIEANIGVFHHKRIESLDKLKLQTILKKKNPYLFKAKYLLTADQIVKSLTDAFISSNEETIFGDWLEGLAIFINSKVYGGWKSGITGIDLEFNREGKRFVVAIKSGPNWGNSSQINKLRSDFNCAKKALRTGNSHLIVIAVNGCCYGQESNPDKGDYLKICGQSFWEFISGNINLYTDLIEPFGRRARERNDEFQKSYAQMINKFTHEFIRNFCTKDGDIDWIKLLEFNSSAQKI